LLKLKEELNATKNRLNHYELEEWNRHTTARNPANEIVTSIKRSGCEFVTNAWCKMYEILGTYPVVNPDNVEVKSMHLCEAPGGFITALNHFLKQNNPKVQFTWTATTLNPYYEGNSSNYTIFDDRFILPSLERWYFGVDQTGNIMNLENIEGMRRQYSGVDLVTADGSIDCHDTPEQQEMVVAKLHMTETIIALKLLKAGGSFVLKMFTMFEDSSVNLMYLLNCCFREVNVFKPATSKGGNSEVYIVCLQFDADVCNEQYLNKVLTQTLADTGIVFPFYTLPDSFLQQLVECARFFKEQQETVIENNIFNFRSTSNDELEKLAMLRDDCVREYNTRYRLGRVDESLRLYKKYCYSQNFYNLNPRTNEGSYAARQTQKAMSGVEKMQELKGRCLQYQATNPLDDRTLLTLTIPAGDTLALFFHLTVGKKIKRLGSTKFLLGPLIQMFNEVLDALALCKHEIGDRNQERRFIHPERVTVERKNDHTFITVEPKLFAKLIVVNYNQYEKDLFYDILDELTKPTLTKVVVINNLVMLSQFMVAFVYFLRAFVFDEIKYDLNGRIVMRGQRAGSKTCLRELKKRVLEESRSIKADEAVLGVVRIQKLFYNVEFYTQIVQYNNNAILKLCDLFLKDVS
jgi:cap2 methyltransferase